MSNFRNLYRVASRTVNSTRTAFNNNNSVSLSVARTQVRTQVIKPISFVTPVSVFKSTLVRSVAPAVCRVATSTISTTSSSGIGTSSTGGVSASGSGSATSGSDSSTSGSSDGSGSGSASSSRSTGDTSDDDADSHRHLRPTDSHPDFQPKKKSPKYSSVKALIENDIKKNHVFLYMKGSPEAPRCGFSRNVVDILEELGIKYGSRDVLQDEAVREGIKQFSKWPTIPQLFIGGEFIGGADIALSMFKSGELEPLLKKKKVNNKHNTGSLPFLDCHV